MVKAEFSLPTLMVALLWLGTLGRCDANEKPSVHHVCPMYCALRRPTCHPPSSLIGEPGCWRCCNIGEYN